MECIVHNSPYLRTGTAEGYVHCYSKAIQTVDQSECSLKYQGLPWLQLALSTICTQYVKNLNWHWLCQNAVVNIYNRYMHMNA